MGILGRQGHLKATLKEHAIDDVEVVTFDDEFVLIGRNHDRARGSFDQILAVIRQSTDYNSLWRQLAERSLLWPQREKGR